MQTIAETEMHHRRLPLEVPWAVYLFASGVLSLAERLISPEGRGVDRVLDLTILIVAGLGLFAAWIFSVRLAWQQSETHSPALLKTRMLLGCLAGPTLGLVIVTAVAWDVDGGQSLLLLPVLGLLLSLLTLPLMIIRMKKANRSSG
jgi:hypothetical protein